jgi:hypothetical protein
MALRDKLQERVQPLLDPGEQVQAVVPAQTGMNPMAVLLVGALIATLVNKYWLIVATDRRIVVMKQSKLRMAPKGVDRELPRATQLGPVSGLWGKSEALGQRTYIHKRFHKDVEQADSQLATAVGYGVLAPSGATATPAGWYPDPQGSGQQRYWDGTTWTDHTAPGGSDTPT